MARRSKPRDYFEPWSSARATAWESAFRLPPVESEYLDADHVIAWHTARDKAEKRASCIVRGSRMAEPAACVSLLGVTTVADDGGIVATFAAHTAEDGTGHADLARRACDCVNALRGVGDPGRLIGDVRALLLDLIKGDADRGDIRIASCLGRMIPADEFEKYSED